MDTNIRQTQGHRNGDKNAHTDMQTDRQGRQTSIYTDKDTYIIRQRYTHRNTRDKHRQDKQKHTQTQETNRHNDRRTDSYDTHRLNIARLTKCTYSRLNEKKSAVYVDLPAPLQRNSSNNT